MEICLKSIFLFIAYSLAYFPTHDVLLSSFRGIGLYRFGIEVFVCV